MKKTILALAIGLTATAASAEVLEGIVVRVGDRIITRSQYERRLRDTYAEIERNAPAERRVALKEETRLGLVNEFISELLIKDRADRLNITITDAEVKEAVTRLKQQYGITTDEQFEQSLRSSGLTRADMEARLRDTLLTQKVFGRELRQRDQLTDAELRDRYNREKEQYRLPERAHLREIVILKPENGSADEARTRATEVAEAARKAGTDFTNLASTMSESGTRDKGGDLGEINRGDLVAAIDQAVFNAQSGAVVGPIETKSAFVIMKVEQRLPSEVPAFDSIKDKLRQDASEETFERDYKAYIETLRKDAFIQINEKMIPAV
ncbi:MAG TPA: peptidyl-prolyl cis-trans isomerase [Thermoanaerobaculia bacterium]|jgi:parvulin-like peptidyl-prolyl isomerase|nr:peptidyl-prolyl cis-trans isomerase [Thermoanaerobaculia bacterium]